MERRRLTPNRVFPSRLDTLIKCPLKTSGHFRLRHCHPVKMGTSNAYGAASAAPAA